MLSYYTKYNQTNSQSNSKNIIPKINQSSFFSPPGARRGGAAGECNACGLSAGEPYPLPFASVGEYGAGDAGCEPLYGPKNCCCWEANAEFVPPAFRPRPCAPPFPSAGVVNAYGDAGAGVAPNGLCAGKTPLMGVPA